MRALWSGPRGWTLQGRGLGRGRLSSLDRRVKVSAETESTEAVSVEIVSADL